MTSDYIWLSGNIKGNRIGIIAFTGLKNKVKLCYFVSTLWLEIADAMM